MVAARVPVHERGGPRRAPGQTFGSRQNKSQENPPPRDLSFRRRQGSGRPGAKEDAMISILIVCLAVSGSILIVAFAWNRIRGVPVSASMPPGFAARPVLPAAPFRFRSRFISRLFSRSSSPCMRAARASLIIVTMEPGSLHPFERPSRFEIPDVADSRLHHQITRRFAAGGGRRQSVRRNSSTIAGTSSDTGIDLGRHLGELPESSPRNGRRRYGTFRASSASCATRVST